MKASLVLTSVLSFALAMTVASQALAQTTYSRDEKYIYIKTPLQLTFDREQMEAVSAAIQKITSTLDAMDANNPRLTPMQKLDDKLIKNADVFEKSLDQILQFSTKYYGDAAQYAHVHLYDAVPTGLLVFGGLEVTANMGVGAGGSVMTGVVLVPQRVKVIRIDDHAVVSDSIGFDSNLVVFPTANVGVGVGGGANARIGVGFIWGSLANAAEFKGLLTGGSASLALGIGNNFKIQSLKNWNKPGAVSNVVFMAAWENGITATAEAHVAASYVVDAQAFFNSLGNGAAALGNKLGLNDGSSKPDLLKPNAPAPATDGTPKKDAKGVAPGKSGDPKPVTAINDGNGGITPSLMLPTQAQFQRNGTN